VPELTAFALRSCHAADAVELLIDGEESDDQFGKAIADADTEQWKGRVGRRRSFFVEASKTEWDETPETTWTLTRMLSEGGIIWTRPIQPTALYRANPIPYEAGFLGCARREITSSRLNGCTLVGTAGKTTR